MRLDLGIRPRYALVAHGAMLLVDGAIDTEWLKQTEKLLSRPLPVVHESEDLFDVRPVNNFFLCAKSENSGQAAARLAHVVDDAKFEVCGVENKVYIIQKPLSKGYALKRLRDRLGDAYLVCAGDSPLDLSMLEMADKAFVPAGTSLLFSPCTVLAAENFTEHLLDAVLQICTARIHERQ
jgi:hydroxymethylpyrimidine pyrophosphatase-like HAD family hydrolase